jgi:dethiobiotin synthetase
MKPVAAGADLRPEGLRSDDAVALIGASNVDAPYSLVNPVCLPLATSPHLAARAAGVTIDPQWIKARFHELARHADVVVVEGAGGWLAPIGESRGGAGPTMQDVAVALRLPVLLVVGVRLGCINHALLTQEAILRSGLEMEGWIANRIDPGFDVSGDYVAALEERLEAPRVEW